MPQTASQVFAAVSRELVLLAEQTSLLQDQLSPAIQAGVDIEALQSLDSLNQTLHCLADYLAALAPHTPCHCALATEDALSTMPLAALAARLRGGRRPAKSGISTIELF